MKSLIIEATPDGINFMQGNESGNYQHQKLIGYKTAIKSLDAGGYDHDLYNGLRVTAAIYEGQSLGYFTPTDEQNMVIYRWIVATLFIHDQLAKNGTVEVTEEDGSKGEAVMYLGEHGGMSIYPAPERLALANNIESIACEMYRENPCAAAVQMYQQFVEVKDGALCLSEFGLDGLTVLHDGFIQTLNEEGLPAKTVTH